VNNAIVHNTSIAEANRRLLRGIESKVMIDIIGLAHSSGTMVFIVDLNQVDAQLGLDRTVMLRFMNPVNSVARVPGRLTIGGLAKASGVGVETVRYYQRRGLLPTPRASGAVRYYPTDLVRRIGFIKKAQRLGFSLDEIATLLDLADGRNRGAVQSVTATRLAEVEAKLADLSRMQAALADMLHQCRMTGQSLPCPIIDALVKSVEVA
jgi:Hg(II)-responsive transcriptional regulator